MPTMRRHCIRQTRPRRRNSGAKPLRRRPARVGASLDRCLDPQRRPDLLDLGALEVVPNPDKGLAFIMYQELQTKHGIVNHENLVFDELIAEKKYQFVYIFPPVPIKGATGSNGCPIAVT